MWLERPIIQTSVGVAPAKRKETATTTQSLLLLIIMSLMIMSSFKVGRFTYIIKTLTILWHIYGHKGVYIITKKLFFMLIYEGNAKVIGV